MQVLCALVCVSLVLKPVYTAVFIQPPVEKPAEFANEEGCYNPDLNKVLPYNVAFSPQDGKTCMQYSCNTDGYTQIFTCGALGVGPGCRKVPGDLTKPYPDCCETMVCDSLPSTDESGSESAARAEAKSE
ncbi:hypothetical protein ABMA28_004142 [Loxostege sticticalis]|uniref:Single domain-containing protein n=1 Tax=Loxostege sticticalis TaxID=481309 RepID=A0ABD0SUW2_LOXSC